MAKTGRDPGYTQWKPYKDGEILLCRVHQIFNESEAQLPLTARQVYYRLLGA